MAGVTDNDSGKMINYEKIPSIDGGAEDSMGTIVQTAHNVPSGAPSYPETPGVSLDGGAYPSGTVMEDKTPGDHVN